MGAKPLQNGDNKTPIGKEYWVQQAKNNSNNDGKTWKAPDGSNNVPVGKTEAKIKKEQAEENLLVKAKNYICKKFDSLRFNNIEQTTTVRFNDEPKPVVKKEEESWLNKLTHRVDNFLNRHVDLEQTITVRFNK